MVWHKLRMVHQAGGQHLPGRFTPAQQCEVMLAPRACPVPNAAQPLREKLVCKGCRTMTDRSTPKKKKKKKKKSTPKCLMGVTAVLTKTMPVKKKKSHSI
jgi:hypothetical protein